MRQHKWMALGLLAALILTGCAAGAEPQNTQSTVDLGSPFQLRIGKTATYPAGGVTVAFNGVTEDSRCPSGAQCAWAGQAVIAIKVSPAAGGPGETSLTLGAAKPGSDVASFGSYVVKLTSLDPLPVADVRTNPDDYIATLVLTKK